MQLAQNPSPAVQRSALETLAIIGIHSTHEHAVEQLCQKWWTANYSNRDRALVLKVLAHRHRSHLCQQYVREAVQLHGSVFRQACRVISQYPSQFTDCAAAIRQSLNSEIHFTEHDRAITTSHPEAAAAIVQLTPERAITRARALLKRGQNTDILQAALILKNSPIGATENVKLLVEALEKSTSPTEIETLCSALLLCSHHLTPYRYRIAKLTVQADDETVDMLNELSAIIGR